MKTQQLHFRNNLWQTTSSSPTFDEKRCQLALVFGDPGLLRDSSIYEELKNRFPAADLVFASTSGEILNEYIFEKTVVVSCLQFEKTVVKCTSLNICDYDSSFAAGSALMEKLGCISLQNILIFSDGTLVNGSELAEGINSKNPCKIPVTGGLAGDAERFQSTLTSLNAIPEKGNIVAIGFDGKSLSVGHGAFGGWDAFGPSRVITRSEKNILYEVDGRCALDIYKEYLGDFARELPGSALLFPLTMREKGHSETVVRTILGINEQEQSMTFAGNLPEGSEVRMMKANFDKLIDAASVAARNCMESDHQSPDFALLISCVGRKLILLERTEEEILAAKGVFGINTCISGFYSYGEISPLRENKFCSLNNQTMTITTFRELLN